VFEGEKKEGFEGAWRGVEIWAETRLLDNKLEAKRC
jgi:hypothetical protein